MLNISLLCFIFTLLELSCKASAFDLGTLKVFNSTKDLNSTFPGTLIVDTFNALEGFIGCFHQAPPHEPQLSRTNYKDCFNAERKIAAQDTRNPILFRRNDTSGFPLPNSFTYRTCVIFLDMISADAEDFFYIREIRDVVIDTARKCTSLVRLFSGVITSCSRPLFERRDLLQRHITQFTPQTTLISQILNKGKY